MGNNPIWGSSNARFNLEPAYRPTMPEISIKEVFPEKQSTIEVSFFKGNSRIREYSKILLIKFSGEYRYGSAGNRDARFMYAMGEYGLNSYQVFGAVIDLRNLQYEWGDMFSLVFDIGENQYSDREFPVSFILGRKCKKAIGTLMFGINSNKPATSQEGIFDSVEEAWKYVEEKIEAHFD